MAVPLTLPTVPMNVQQLHMHRHLLLTIMGKDLQADSHTTIPNLSNSMGSNLDTNHLAMGMLSHSI